MASSTIGDISWVIIKWIRRRSDEKQQIQRTAILSNPQPLGLREGHHPIATEGGNARQSRL
jgi:hypothetical protein